jgi:predicted transposase/invertase (TIGR01784 family)
MKKNHVEDAVIDETITKLREGGFEEGMFAYSEELDVRKAKIEGKIEASFEIARNLYKMGLSVEQIAEGTELSIEKIKEILQEKGKKDLN